MKNTHIILVLTLTFFISCKNDTKSAGQNGSSTSQESINRSTLLLGTWKTSTFINEDQVKKVFKDDMEEGMSGEITLVDEYQFIKGNRFNQEGELTLTLKMGGQEVPLKFYAKQSGSWSLHDNTLVTVTEDAKVIAMDDLTRNVLASAPEFKEMLELEPTKGESVSLEIKALTETVLQVVDEDLSGLVLTYNKKYYFL
ncbi:hypothetical protein [Kordia sp.]|uniref:hypothetical protein n=1 Tax=Kordia sp. TaxID=1965332 RepID=UPI0025C43682|nr:hypothetical protein [Kordia sp.]MCH2196499.1 hypothetical protein [Kordia sp.]